MPDDEIRMPSDIQKGDQRVVNLQRAGATVYKAWNPAKNLM